MQNKKKLGTLCTKMKSSDCSDIKHKTMKYIRENRKKKLATNGCRAAISDVTLLASKTKTKLNNGNYINLEKFFTVN